MESMGRRLRGRTVIGYSSLLLDIGPTSGFMAALKVATGLQREVRHGVVVQHGNSIFSRPAQVPMVGECVALVILSEPYMMIEVPLVTGDFDRLRGRKGSESMTGGDGYFRVDGCKW